MGFDAFEDADFDDFSELSCDRLAFLLGRVASSSDDELDLGDLGDMLPTALVLFVDEANLEALDVGTCIPREDRDSDLRRVS